MTRDHEHCTANARRLAVAVVHLLDVEERAMTRGHAGLRRLAAGKAAEASATLHNLAMDRLDAAARRPRSKLESLHGRFW